MDQLLNKANLEKKESKKGRKKQVRRLVIKISCELCLSSIVVLELMTHTHKN